MTNIEIVGLGIWLIGAGVRGVPQGDLIGAIAQIVGGIVVLIGALLVR